MTTKYTGRDINLGIGKEASRGTPVSATYWIPGRSYDFEDQATTIVDEQGYCVIEDSTDVQVVSTWAEGSITGIVRDKAMGLLLLGAFGEVTSTPTGDSYEHTYSIAQNHQHPSLTIEVAGGVSDVAYPLGMIKSLEFNATINEVVLFTADFMSQVSQAATPTASYVAETSFVCNDAKAYFAATTADLAAAAETNIKSAKLTIEKEVEKDDILGKATPDDLLNKVVRVSVEIEKNYENNTFKDMFTAGTGQAMRLALKSGTPVSLTFDLNQVKLTSWTREKGLDDIIKETFTAKANYKIADAEMIEAKLINAVTSY